MKKKVIKYINKHINENFENKTIVITGGNSGIGFESARNFSYLKAHVIIACRSLEKGNDAINKIKQEIPYANIELIKLDISDKTSIEKFVKEIETKHIDIDIFYHNAGVYRLPFELINNSDIITCTNYFGPFLLTSDLLPYLHSLNHPVRMLITSSCVASYTNMTNDLLYPHPTRSRMKRYSDSKMMDAILFKYLLENDKSNIEYIMVHPGVAYTGLINKAYKSKFIRVGAKLFLKTFANPLWKSGLSSLPASTKNAPIGAFIGPTHLFNTRGYPKNKNFLKRKYKDVDSFIKETEKILNQKLIKQGE